MKTLLVVPLFLAWINLNAASSGIIDVIEDKNVLVEIESSVGVLKNFVVPLDVFPCKIKEGDVVYFERTLTTTEIRCEYSKSE